jgi:hypothetical protein
VDSCASVSILGGYICLGVDKEALTGRSISLGSHRSDGPVCLSVCLSVSVTVHMAYREVTGQDVDDDADQAVGGVAAPQPPAVAPHLRGRLDHLHACVV